MSEKIKWLQAVRVTSFKNIQNRFGRFIDTRASSAIQLNPGDRILLKNQTLPSEDGVYRVSDGPSYIWTRSSDFKLQEQSYRVGVLSDHQMSTWIQTSKTGVGSNSTKWVSEEEFLKKHEKKIKKPVEIKNPIIVSNESIKLRPPPSNYDSSNVDLLGLGEWD
jgi:hypothetical protein